jgi:GT2 family glycosyltransferase
MRILGHIHTLNDEDVIDQSLRALLDQTYPLNEVLLVDNASTDGTLRRSFPETVTVIRHPDNRGTSGAVITGFQYAIDKGYDWIWVLDADSIAENNALEELVRLYSDFSPEVQSRTRVLASLPVETERRTPIHGALFGSLRLEEPTIDPEATFHECDSNLWSGSLFNLRVVKEIGMPNKDYFLDWGDHEYAYRGKEGGYRMFVSHPSIIHHSVHIMPNLRMLRFGKRFFPVWVSPPVRRYYYFRNFAFFWLYDYLEKRSFLVRLYCVLRSLLGEMVKIGIYNKKPASELLACTRGLWDGLFKKMHRRF